MVYHFQLLEYCQQDFFKSIRYGNMKLGFTYTIQYYFIVADNIKAVHFKSLVHSTRTITTQVLHFRLIIRTVRKCSLEFKEMWDKRQRERTEEWYCFSRQYFFSIMS